MNRVIYLLMYDWTDFETHHDILGVYETRELAEKAAEEYRNLHTLWKDFDAEFCVKQALLNRFVWELNDSGDGDGQ